MMSAWAWNHHRLRKRFATACIHPGALAAADGWHATSVEEADDIRRLGYRQPVCVAPNGVMLPAADRLIATGAAWRERCPLIGKRPVALFYSRFHRKKRLRELFHLWLAAPRDDWFLLIVGVPEEYSVADIQDWITAAGAQDRVAVFDGTDLPAPYAVASLFLLPSHSENFALVIAEAMAAGVPVVVTDTTPWMALNTDDRGWCVPWADFHRTLMLAMAEGPSRLAERGQRARAWVLEEFSWEKSARKLTEFYQQLQGPSP
jgi:glycosyltransferase involved in cell wall biosynthesis